MGRRTNRTSPDMSNYPARQNPGRTTTPPYRVSCCPDCPDLRESSFSLRRRSSLLVPLDNTCRRSPPFCGDPNQRRHEAGEQQLVADRTGSRVCLLLAKGVAAAKISGIYKAVADTRMPLLETDTAVEVKSGATGFDATTLTSQWGAQAQAFGWTSRDLFGLHPVPEHPAANYSRLSRLDYTGMIWLLRGRPVIALTAAEAVMRCHSSATLTYRRQNKPVAKAAEIDEATLDAAEIAKGATA
jgi:hypothetical protein